MQETNATIGEDEVADYITADVDGDNKIGLAEIIPSLTCKCWINTSDFH